MCAKTSELMCQSCGRVEELSGLAFDRAQFCAQEGQTEQSPILTTRSFTHLRKILEKYRILVAVNIIVTDSREVYDPTRCRFLRNFIHHFSHDPKSVNYICFLQDFFQAVSSKAWPRKAEILELISPTFQKIASVTPCHAKERFDKWWATA